MSTHVRTLTRLSTPIHTRPSTRTSRVRPLVRLHVRWVVRTSVTTFICTRHRTYAFEDHYPLRDFKKNQPISSKICRFSSNQTLSCRNGHLVGHFDGPSTSPSHRKLNIIPVKGPKQCVGGWETNVPDTSNSSHGTAAHDNRSG